MLNTIIEKISVLKDELDYQVKLRQNESKLPALTGHDLFIANSLKNEGICITTLEALGLPSTSQLLSAAHDFLPNMGKSNYHSLVKNPPEIYTVTHLNDFYNWEMNRNY